MGAPPGNRGGRVTAVLVVAGVCLCLAGWHRGGTPDAALIVPGLVLCAIAFGIMLGQVTA